MQQIYNQTTIPHPPIPRDILAKLLIACTTKCPITHINGDLHLQQDGVSTGSPLGVTFANFYMTYVEINIFELNISLKPTVFCRYVDDCFMVVKTLKHYWYLNKLLNRTQFSNSRTKLALTNKINFLVVHITSEKDNYLTSVFQMPTNFGIYLHYNSECPQRYKDGTVSALIHRTFKISSNWQLFDNTINKLEQTFINYGYPNKLFDSILQNYLNKKCTVSSKNIAPPNTHNIYYQNQFSNSYKTDERIIKQIVKDNTKCVNESDLLKITIYYKSHT